MQTCPANIFVLFQCERLCSLWCSCSSKVIERVCCDIRAGMIEHGLVDSSHYRPKSSVSEDQSLVESVSGAEEFVSVSVTDIDGSALDFGVETAQPATESSGNSSEGDNHHLKPPSRISPESSESEWETLDPSVLDEGGPQEAPSETEPELPETFDSKPGTPITVQPQAVTGQGGVTQGLVSGLEEDQYGLPLAIFTKVTAAINTSVKNSVSFEVVQPSDLNLRGLLPIAVFL